MLQGSVDIVRDVTDKDVRHAYIMLAHTGGAGHARFGSTFRLPGLPRATCYVASAPTKSAPFCTGVGKLTVLAAHRPSTTWAALANLLITHICVTRRITLN